MYIYPYTRIFFLAIANCMLWYFMHSQQGGCVCWFCFFLLLQHKFFFSISAAGYEVVASSMAPVAWVVGLCWITSLSIITLTELWSLFLLNLFNKNIFLPLSAHCTICTVVYSAHSAHWFHLSLHSRRPFMAGAEVWAAGLHSLLFSFSQIVALLNFHVMRHKSRLLNEDNFTNNPLSKICLFMFLYFGENIAHFYIPCRLSNKLMLPI